jgi:hypothetical protein
VLQAAFAAGKLVEGDVNTDHNLLLKHQRRVDLLAGAVDATVHGDSISLLCYLNLAVPNLPHALGALAILL